MNKEITRGFAQRENEDWSSFQERIRSFPLESQKKLRFAYNIAKSAHREQTRKDGDRYFEHARAVALILMDECSITDPDIIVTAFIHDTLEDTSIWGNPAKLPPDQWREEASEHIARNFGQDVAEWSFRLTKPFVDGTIIKTKQESEEIQHLQLVDAPGQVLLVKMADRLHNLRSIASMSREQQIKKVRETEKYYMPLFQHGYSRYPQETSYLLSQITEEMTRILQSN